MATQTPNLNLDLREASDIFNPLSTNSNFETLDSVISDIQKKGGIVTYTTTASANLLKLSGNPTPNDTVFKFVAAGDANTWSYQETVNNIVALDGKQKTVKAGEMYVAWVNAANALTVIAWPDVVNAQTFDGKDPSEWASKAQLDSVSEAASNATQTAQAAATVANNALDAANKAGFKMNLAWSDPNSYSSTFSPQTISLSSTVTDNTKFLMIECRVGLGNIGAVGIIPVSLFQTNMDSYIISSIPMGAGYFASRGFKYTSTTKELRIGTGFKNYAEDNTCIMPTRIWAVD